MGEPREATYADGDVVWVKLGSCWWPGEVCGFDKLPPGLLGSFRKPPIAVVKFFQESSFEYVKNVNFIFKYDCDRKHEFIKKGLDLHRSKHSHMEKFPEDVQTAERLTDGDPDIITREEFLPETKLNYADIFKSPDVGQSKRPSSKRGRPSGSPRKRQRSSTGESPHSATKIFYDSAIRKRMKGTSDYKAHILVQPNNSHADDEVDDPADIASRDPDEPSLIKSKPDRNSTPAGGQMALVCPACNFSCSRMSVLILHNRTHSGGSAPPTPVKRPKAKSPPAKTKTKGTAFSSMGFDENTDVGTKKKKTPNATKPRSRPKNVLESIAMDVISADKSKIRDKLISPPKRKSKAKDKESKKPKTDVEIKKSLLADWNEDSDDESMDIFTSLKLTENQNSSNSSQNKSEPNDKTDVKPEKDASRSLEETEVEVSDNASIKNDDVSKVVDKQERVSCFDFDEEEDLQIEKLDRKIPRVSNKSEEFSRKNSESGNSTSETVNETTQNILNNLNADDATNTKKLQSEMLDFDSEVSNLLKDTTMPDLPAIPASSNFQKSNIVKVPDKEKDGDSQYIFKTKTFFRSRHSRSQDAIEKYVSDNTSSDKPLTYMEEPLTDIEKSSDLSIESNSTDTVDDENVEIKRTSPPKETTKVTKFAPKIQLKKLKAALENKEVVDDAREVSSINIEKDTKIEHKEVSEDTLPSDDKVLLGDNNKCALKSKRVPTESDLQIAETLVSLPTSTIHSVHDKLSENKELSLEGHIKESKSNTYPPKLVSKTLGDDENVLKEDIQTLHSKSKSSDTNNANMTKEDIKTSTLSDRSSKLYQILDTKTKNRSQLKILSSKIIKPQGKEKILNFGVGAVTKRKLGSGDSSDIIIMRKNTLSSFEAEDFNSSQELILSTKRDDKWNEDDVQTFTIEDTDGANQDVFDPKIKKVNKASTHTFISTSGKTITNADKTFGIETRNEIPMVKSNVSALASTSIKHKVNTAELAISEKKGANSQPQPVKRPRITVKSVIEKSANTNILPKNINTKSVKHLIITEKDVSEMTNSEISDNAQRLSSLSQIESKKPISPKITTDIVGMNQTSSNIDSKQLDRFTLNLDTKKKTSNMRILNKGNLETSSGSAVMIVTNAKGVQSKIMLKPEHSKLILTKNKIVTSPTNTEIKSNISINKSKSTEILQSRISETPIVYSRESQPQIQKMHIVQKNKGAILNPKGQLVVSGNGSKRTILTTMPGQAILTSKGQIIAPQSSIISSQAKILSPSQKPTILSSNNPNIKNIQSQKLLKFPQKEPSYILSQKSGTVLRLTAAEFEQLQKTGQLPKSVIQKNSAQNLMPSGKIENQKNILHKFVSAKQTINSFETKPVEKCIVELERGKQESESILSGRSTVSSINSEKTTVSKKQNHKETIIRPESEETSISNNVKKCDSDNLDKLIPGTVIPTRKRESVTEDKNYTEVVQNKADTTPTSSTKTNIMPENEQSLSSSSLNDPQKQLLAIPGENFGGPPNSFFLCVEENGTLTPVDNQPLVLENNQLVPMTSVPATTTTVESQEIVLEKNTQAVDSTQVLELPVEQAQRSILINTGDQQILVDQQAFLSLLAGDGQQLVTADGQNLVLQGGTQQLLSALAGNPEIANLLTGGQQVLLNSGEAIVHQNVNEKELQIIVPTTTENGNFTTEIQPTVNQDILAAALASTEVFQPDSLISETVTTVTGTEGILMEIDTISSNLQVVNTNTGHSNVFETSSTLNQPIMSPLEHPTKKRTDEPSNVGLIKTLETSKISPKNLEDSLAVIGVGSTNVPTSLELPITVTNPRIAIKTPSPLELGNGVYQSGILNNSMVSPGLSIFTSETSSSFPITSPSVSNNSENAIKSDNQCIDDTTKEVTISEENIESNEKIEEKKIEDVSQAVDKMEVIDNESPDKAETNETNEMEDEPISSAEPNFQSSMPSLDENPENLEGVIKEPDNIEVKSFSPKSMPILVDDEKLKDNKSEIECESSNMNDSSVEDQSNSEPAVQPEIIEDTDTNVVKSEILSHENLQDAKNEICIQPLNTTDKDDENGPPVDTESEEICADTPPDMTRSQSPIQYDDQDMVDTIPNEAENSVSDHVCDEINISSISETIIPDSTSSSVETISTPEPPTSSLLFSDSSSDNSTEIPIQPAIAVSHHLVQNFSSLLNRTTPEDKSNECGEVEMCENFEDNEKKLTEGFEVNSER